MSEKPVDLANLLFETCGLCEQQYGQDDEDCSANKEHLFRSCSFACLTSRNWDRMGRQLSFLKPPKAYKLSDIRGS